MLLKWDFAAVNAGAIKTALRSIESDVLRHNRVVQQSSERGARKPTTPATGPGTPAHTSKAEEKAAKEQARAHEKAERDKVRASEKAAREQTRAHDKALKEQTRATEKEAREQARIQERWTAYNAKMKDQHFRAQSRKEEELVMATARKRQQYATATRGVLGGAVGTLTSVGRKGMVMASVAGGALFASAIHGRMKDMRSASGLANQMAQTGDTAETINKSKTGILKQAQMTRGFTTNEALEAQRTFGGKAGDYALGGKMLQQFADVSLATDVEINDVADVAANAYMKLKSENPGEGQAALMDRVMEAVSIFAGQGNVGAVEMKDLAAYAGRLTAAAAKFEGPRLLSMARMGALAQIAIGSGTASSAEEATTASGRFASDLTKHTVAQKKYGIQQSDIYAKKSDGTLDLTTHKAIPDILKTMMVKTGGSLPAMTKLVGEESKKMMEGISLEYNTAEKRNAAIKDPAKRLKKGEAGSAAIDALFATFEKAALTKGDREERAKSALDEPSMRFAESLKQLQIAVADRLMPAVIHIVPKLELLVEPVGRAAEGFAKLIPVVESAIGWLMENPWKGLGAAISFAVGKEILGAGIGLAVKTAIEKAIALLIGGPNVPVPGATPGAPPGVTKGNGLLKTLGSVISGSAMNVAPGAAATVGTAAGGLGVGAIAGMAGVGALGVGSVIAVGLQQQKRESDQKVKGHIATMTLEQKLAGYEGDTQSFAPLGLWGQATAEEEALTGINKSRKRANETASSFSDISAHESTAADLRDQVTAAVNSAMGGQPKTEDLASAMRELTAALQQSSVTQPNRGDGSTWLSKRPQ